MRTNPGSRWCRPTSGSATAAISNFNNTDLNGYAGFNEVFPLFNWYVVETDSTRYKNTGTHVVYDAGGPADGNWPCVRYSWLPACGNSTIGAEHGRTQLKISLCPRTCGFRARCIAPMRTALVSRRLRRDSTAVRRLHRPNRSALGYSPTAGRASSGQNSFLEFGKKPFAPGENGGIHGHVVYASTRPFDDPALLLQLSWEPLVPHVTINLYQEGTAADGSRQP